MRERYDSLISRIALLQGKVLQLKAIKQTFDNTVSRLRQARNEYDIEANKRQPNSEVLSALREKADKEKELYWSEQVEFARQHYFLLNDLSNFKSDLESLKYDDACQRFSYGYLESSYNDAISGANSMNDFYQMK
jgi:FtsZ-binding cell division protein ZapB